MWADFEITPCVILIEGSVEVQTPHPAIFGYKEVKGRAIEALEYCGKDNGGPGFGGLVSVAPQWAVNVFGLSGDEIGSEAGDGEG